MAEDPFWRSVRLTYEALDEDCPEGHRTVAVVHLVSGHELEINHVRPYRDGWIFVQNDHTVEETPEVNFIRDHAIYRIQVKYTRDMRERTRTGFFVEDPESE